MQTIQIAAAVLHRDGKVLFARRRTGKANAGLWEFPGGKIEAGETAVAALEREIGEEFGAAIQVGEALPPFVAEMPSMRIHFHCFLATLLTPIAHMTDHDAVQWVAVADCRQVSPLSPADQPIVDWLGQHALPDPSRI